MQPKPIHSPLDYFLEKAKQHPDKIFLSQPYAAKYRHTTFEQARDQVLRVSGYLKKNSKHRHIGIISLNCDGWILADLAIMAAGKVSVPLYPTASTETLVDIIRHSEMETLFVGKLFDEDKLNAIKQMFPRLQIISFFRQRARELSWQKIVDTSPPLDKIAVPDQKTVATIVYTSGTTGQPKGVVITYRAWDAVFKCVRETLEITADERFFSYLPLSHVAERVAVELAACYYGCQIYFVESMETFSRNLAAARPTIFFAVPRIWEKFRQAIESRMGGSKVTQWLIEAPVIGSLIRRKIVQGLGLNEAKICLSAAAPISLGTLRWYQKLGIRIDEAYGMTETCGLSHLNRTGAHKMGTVGRPLLGCEIMIADNNEVLLRNPGLMEGYYKDEALTEAVMQDDWLRTGDLGVEDSEGFLQITGRVKDLFKTSKGKYVAPIPIEHQLAQVFANDQICVMGSGLPQPIAVVSVTDQEALRKFDLGSIAKYEQAVNEINQRLEKHERLSRVLISQIEWTTENNLLTPTLKIRRQSLEEYYLNLYRKTTEYRKGHFILLLNELTEEQE